VNLRRAKRYILLEQSGELSARKRRRLHACLAHSPQAREFRDTLQRWTGVVGSEGSSEVPAYSMSLILEAGRRALEAGPRREPVSFPAMEGVRRPAFLYAALALLLLAGILIFVRKPSPPMVTEAPTEPRTTALTWNGSIDEEIEELNTWISMAASDMEETGFSRGTEFDALATELLALEDERI